MPEIKVLNMAGESVGTMNLSDAIFAADVNGAVLHAAVKMYLGNQSRMQFSLQPQSSHPAPANLSTLHCRE